MGTESCQPSPAGRNTSLQIPSAKEVNEFYHPLSDKKSNWCDSFFSSRRNIKSVTDLFQLDYLRLPYADLLCTDGIKAIEKDIIPPARGSAVLDVELVG